jgi:hypothetical protein
MGSPANQMPQPMSGAGPFGNIGQGAAVGNPQQMIARAMMQQAMTPQPAQSQGGMAPQMGGAASALAMGGPILQMLMAKHLMKQKPPQPSLPQPQAPEAPGQISNAGGSNRFGMMD